MSDSCAPAGRFPARGPYTDASGEGTVWLRARSKDCILRGQSGTASDSSLWKGEVGVAMTDRSKTERGSLYFDGPFFPCETVFSSYSSSSSRIPCLETLISKVSVLPFLFSFMPLMKLCFEKSKVANGLSVLSVIITSISNDILDKSHN